MIKIVYINCINGESVKYSKYNETKVELNYMLLKIFDKLSY